LEREDRIWLFLASEVMLSRLFSATFFCASRGARHVAARIINVPVADEHGHPDPFLVTCCCLGVAENAKYRAYCGNLATILCGVFFNGQTRL